MKALILAAGFGTRLEKSLKDYVGPNKEQLTKLVEGKPKGLVQIVGKPIITYQLDQITEAGISLTDIYIHTNQKYYEQFLEWANKSGIPTENVFNNGVTKNEDRNEQVKDLLLALNMIGYDQPLFLFASDTLVYGENNSLLDLSSMVEIYQQQNFSSVVVCYKEKGAFNHGIFTVDEELKVTGFREKPERVESGLINVSVYFFTPEKLNQIKTLSDELLQYKNILELVHDKFSVVLAKKRVDIGTIEDVIGVKI